MLSPQEATSRRIQRMKKWLWSHFLLDEKLEPDWDPLLAGRAKRVNDKRKRNIEAARIAYAKVALRWNIL
jgi:hypothetical protein